MVSNVTLTPGFAFEYLSTAATTGDVNTAWDGNPDRASMVNGWMAATVSGNAVAEKVTSTGRGIVAAL